MTDIEIYNPTLTGTWDSTGATTSVAAPLSDANCATKKYADENATVMTLSNNQGSQINDLVYMPLQGSQLDDTDIDDVYQVIPVNCTMSNFFIRVEVNTHIEYLGEEGTFKLIIDGTPGNIKIDLPTEATGVFKDTVNTDALVAGNLVAIEANFDTSDGALSAVGMGALLSI